MICYVIFLSLVKENKHNFHALFSFRRHMNKLLIISADRQADKKITSNNRDDYNSKALGDWTKRAS